MRISSRHGFWARKRLFYYARSAPGLEALEINGLGVLPDGNVSGVGGVFGCYRVVMAVAVGLLAEAAHDGGHLTDALTMAWFRRKPASGLLHHSDRGRQYASQAFQGRLKECGMTCSMSRKGNCRDNAPTESWSNRFKNERVHGECFATRAEMTAMAFEYIEVF